MQSATISKFLASSEVLPAVSLSWEPGQFCSSPHSTPAPLQEGGIWTWPPLLPPPFQFCFLRPRTAWTLAFAKYRVMWDHRLELLSDLLMVSCFAFVSVFSRISHKLPKDRAWHDVFILLPGALVFAECHGCAQCTLGTRSLWHQPFP